MDVLTIILLVLAVLAALTGIVGVVVPVLPGVPLCLAGLTTVYFVCPGTIPLCLLVIMIVITVICAVLDYIAPLIITKKGGGSKWAMWGTTIGLVVGLFFLPWGLILGPLTGAFWGEYIHSKETVHSLKIASLSFVSFVIVLGIKLVSGFMMTYFVIDAIVTYMKSVG